MTDRHPMTDDAVRSALADLPGWSHTDGAISKTFVFTDFREAIGFVVRVAFDAEALNHHPELSNVYNRVTVRLTTHDAGNQVTPMDVALASAIEKFSWIG